MIKKITFLLFALVLSVLPWQASAQIPIGVQDGISANIPINGLYNYSYSQQLVHQDEINANGDITSISFFFSTTDNTGNNNDWTIYLGHTSKTQFASTTDWIAVADLTQVFDGIVTFPAPGNWMQITFDQPFNFNNTDNLVVAVVEKSSGYSSTAFGRTPTVTGSSRSLYWSSDTVMPNPSAPATAKSKYDYMNTMILGGIQQSCPAPSNVAVTGTTVDTATLSWTENGSATEWEVKYGTPGFDPEVAGTSVAVSTNPSTTLTGLSASTAYDLYVKAICGTDDESNFVGPLNFRTACSTVSALPYTENFDSYGTGPQAFPACWERVTYTSGSNIWPSIVSSNATSAPNSLKFQSAIGTPTYAISPAFDEDIQNLQVTFMLKREGTSSGTIDVGVMSNASDINTFELVQTINPTDNDYHEYVFNLNQVTISGPGNVIALRHNSNSGIWYYWLDDFEVGLVPSCIEPTSLEATDITQTSADVSWTPGDSETAWNISWGPSGYTPGDADEMGNEALVAPSFQISNLTANTNYDVYVQSDCGGGDLSDWAGPLHVRTLCGAMTEMFENFDSYATGSIVPDCWERMVPATSPGSQTISSTSPASGTRNIYHYTNSSSNSIIVALPEFSNIDAGTHWLRLQARVSSGTGTLSVGYVTDVTDYDSFTLIQDLNITNTSYGSNSEYTVVVPNTVPAGARLAIKSEANGTSHYWDDVYWEQVPTCLPPTELVQAAVSSTSVDVSWTAGATESGWNISWGPTGFTPGDSDEIGNDVTATASYQITGLTADTHYDVYVQADCDVDGVSAWAGPLGVYTGYCIPTGSSNNSDEIRNFTLGNLNNDSAASEGTDGYSDYTASVAPAELEAGMAYEASLTSGTGSGNHGAAIWIDLNDNMVFEASEMVASIPNSIGASATVSFPEFTLPADTPSGTYRLRVQYHYNKDGDLLDPCVTSTSYSETEDYAVNITGSGGTFPSPYCNIDESGGAVIVEEITKVELADTVIINDNTEDVLIDKTEVVVDLTTNNTYTLSVEGNTHGDFTTNIVAFIDWNQNGILDDEGEIYELGTLENSTGSDGVSVSMDIAVPADAVLGETRIRITKTYFDDLSDAIVTPCGIQFDPFGMGTESGYGQALDFTINVEEGTEPGIDCDQGDDSNIFENGFNITGGGDFRNADDFIVSPDNTLNIRSIELNIMSMTPIASLDLNFFNDDNGAPGSTVVESLTGLIPYAQTVIGNAFGFNVYSVLVEVDLEFEGGPTGTSYWMQPVAQGGTAYWEVTSVGTLGLPIHTSEAMGAWEADVDGSDGVFKLYCDVAPPPPFECMFNITSSVEPITRVQMANVDNTSSPSSTVVLEDFTSMVINAEAGSTIDVVLEGNTAGNFTNYFTVFINTDDEEEWSSYEMFEIGSITNSTGTDGQQATATITLPTSLTEGEYLLRVVKNYGASPTSPCASYSYGQGEDYTLMIGELEDCAGTPDGGVAMVNPEEGNINTPYTVSATGYSTGNGLTYQWQSNTDGAGWVDEGALLDNYASYAAIAPDENDVSVEWRLEVTCTLSSETSYSETATFTTGIFYCVPDLDCSDADMITNVTFQEIDNTTDCSPDGYGDYTSMVATVQSGGTYPISVTVGDGWSSESVSVWIDFDDSGSFDEDEFFFIGTGSAEALTGDISIPADVADGDYIMRVRVAAVGEATATWDMACDETQGFGETEDYMVTVDGTVGIQDYSNLNFSFYPNPMAEVLYITANQPIESVAAYNVLGQQVISNKQFADGKVDVSSLPTGTFIFRVTFEGGLEENFKVIKE